MKLVPSRRKYLTLPTEVENLKHLASTVPAMRTDPSVAFPVKLLDCVPKFGQQTQNLIIMPRALGVRLGDWVGLAVARGHTEAIARTMETLGRDLRLFHERYGRQHADFQPSNVFLGWLSGSREPETEHGSNVFIDIGGVGTPVGETDQVHFLKALELLGKAYGQPFVQLSTEAFEKGYAGGA